MCAWLTNKTPVGIAHNIIYYYNTFYIYIYFFFYIAIDASRAGCCEWAQEIWTLSVLEVKNDINTVQFLAQTDRFMS